MKIELKNIVRNTYQNSEGTQIYYYLKDYLEKDIRVELSMLDVNPFSSSFFNSSLGKLLNEYGFDGFRARIKIIDINKSQAIWLKKYFDDYKYISEKIVI